MTFFHKFTAIVAHCEKAKCCGVAAIDELDHHATKVAIFSCLFPYINFIQSTARSRFISRTREPIAEVVYFCHESEHGSRKMIRAFSVYSTVCHTCFCDLIYSKAPHLGFDSVPVTSSAAMDDEFFPQAHSVLGIVNSLDLCLNDQVSSRRDIFLTSCPVPVTLVRVTLQTLLNRILPQTFKPRPPQQSKVIFELLLSHIQLSAELEDSSSALSRASEEEESTELSEEQRKKFDEAFRRLYECIAGHPFSDVQRECCGISPEEVEEFVRMHRRSG